jgi:hypothetical protein
VLPLVEVCECPCAGGAFLAELFGEEEEAEGVEEGEEL